MADLFEELAEEVVQHDKYQFEIHDDYSAEEEGEKIYSKEFYFFIPASLQINRNTYTKKQFFLDHTTLIRYKTPEISLKELQNLHSSLSPLGRIMKKFIHPSSTYTKEIKFELKLFGNIIRSQIRNRVKKLLTDLEQFKQNSKLEAIDREIVELCTDIQFVRKTFTLFKERFFSLCPNILLQKFCDYVDEFLNLTINFFLLRLLKKIRSINSFTLKKSDEIICQLILQKKNQEEEKENKKDYLEKNEIKLESFLYRAGILNKFVLESLLLLTIRKEPAKIYEQLIAMVAAGGAMLLYVVLFVWYGPRFVVDASAFITISVLLYILKDRVKDGIKYFFYRFASSWFPDYSMKIERPSDKQEIGLEKEYFTYLDRDQVPKEVLKIRDTSFHRELEEARRIENIFYFKKEIILKQHKSNTIPGLKDLHDVFRYNISQFLLKASDIFEDYLDLDMETLKLESRKYPKVYHINMIILKTIRYKNIVHKDEVKKVRLIINKEGILRVENLI